MTSFVVGQLLSGVVKLYLSNAFLIESTFNSEHVSENVAKIARYRLRTKIHERMWGSEA